jgi:dienelactone hydrolase
MKTIVSDFTSAGIHCSGVLMMPDRKKKPPVIVMAHGLGLQKDCHLPVIARRFVDAGFAVYMFDYRSFGESGGTPRNWISHRRHLTDIAAAIAHVKTLPVVDGSRMGLWGTSYGGGHVLTTAARVAGISAVAAQVPFVSGVATTMSFPLSYQLQGFLHGIIDAFSWMFRLPPHRVPIVADPGTFALMNTAESRPGYMALVPKKTTWVNLAPARLCMTLPSYMPTLYAGKIPCPAQVIYAENDSLIPARAVERMIKKIKNVESISLPVGHFDLYRGKLFEKTIKAQTAFFTKHLM